MESAVTPSAIDPADPTAWQDVQYPTMACATCEMCNLWCQPVRDNPARYQSLDWFKEKRTQIRRGEYLFRAGEPFRSVYVLRNGFLKVSMVNQGTERVTAFCVAGELVGLDAIHFAQHNCSAVALEDGFVCEVPFDHLERLCQDEPTSQRRLHQFMSREIMRHYEMVNTLVGKSVEQRLAAFLLNLSERLAQHSLSATRIHLRMSRDDIGCYLGMTVESVSRAMRKFHGAGLVSAHGKHLDLIDFEGLRRAAGSDGSQVPA
jgi:CRP/FNR family transcriptional regulator, anaerobic regulatory protein